MEALVILGGEGSHSLGFKMMQKGIPVIGIPKTIDNDIVETDFSIGFQTAVQTATDALDRLRSTAESHHRVMLLEVMGRNTGWIATYAGMANGADEILIPEVPLTEQRLNDLCERLKNRRKIGIKFSIIVVAEGVRIPDKNTREKSRIKQSDNIMSNLGGVAEQLGEILKERTGLETRVSTLGYIQRGGTPVSYDRTLATAFGAKAFKLLNQKKRGPYASFRATDYQLVF